MKHCLKVLICASTEGEIAGIKPSDTVDTLVTGVGYFSTVYNLTKTLLLHEYCLVFAVGIAGDYRLDNAVPQMYVVENARFADTGFEGENGEFVPLVGSRFMPDNQFPFNNGVIHSNLAQHFAQHYGIDMCTANTVNRTRTDREYIEKMLKKFPAEIETMESAALHYVAQLQGVPMIEIRSTSNHVAPKSAEKWKIAEATDALNNFLNNNIIVQDINDLTRIICHF